MDLYLGLSYYSGLGIMVSAFLGFIGYNTSFPDRGESGGGGGNGW